MISSKAFKSRKHHNISNHYQVIILIASLLFFAVYANHHKTFTHESSANTESFVINVRFSVAACAANNLSKGSRDESIQTHLRDVCVSW